MNNTAEQEIKKANNMYKVKNWASKSQWRLLAFFKLAYGSSGSKKNLWFYDKNFGINMVRLDYAFRMAWWWDLIYDTKVFQ
jgi:hypothetical protein